MGSFATALLSALAGGGAAAYIADRCIEWFHISGFEGKSGYFFVLCGLVGIIGGFIIGLVAARTTPSWIAGLGRGLGVTTAFGLIVLGLCRLSGDVPPQLDGEEMNLLMELRYPASAPIEPAEYGGNHVSLFGIDATGRRSSHQLWDELDLDQTRTEGDAKITPAAIFLDSRPAKRLAYLYIANKVVAEFELPIPAKPSAEHQEWSEWKDIDGGFAYRVRVQKVSEAEPDPEP